MARFAELSKQHRHVTFLHVDVDEMKPHLEEAHYITVLPSFVFLKQGQRLHKLLGADEAELRRWTEKLATSSSV